MTTTRAVSEPEMHKYLLRTPKPLWAKLIQRVHSGDLHESLNTYLVRLIEADLKREERTS